VVGKIIEWLFLALYLTAIVCMYLVPNKFSAHHIYVPIYKL